MWRRWLILVAALGLLLAACGGGDEHPGHRLAAGEHHRRRRLLHHRTAAAVDPEQAVLDFAACMREHGVDMPDPEIDSAGGGIAFGFTIQGKRAEGPRRRPDAADAGGQRGLPALPRRRRPGVRAARHDRDAGPDAGLLPVHAGPRHRLPRPRVLRGRRRHHHRPGRGDGTASTPATPTSRRPRRPARRSSAGPAGPSPSRAAAAASSGRRGESGPVSLGGGPVPPPGGDDDSSGGG